MQTNNELSNQDKRDLIVNQIELQNEMQGAGYNLVNCGHCGSVFIHRTNDENDNVICPFCYSEMEKSDCPDYFYEGLETSAIFEFNN